MQARPTHELDGALLEVEIPGQHGFDVTGIGIHIHRLAQFDHAAELVAADGYEFRWSE